MLFSSIGFFAIIGIIVITCGGSVYWFLHEKKQVSFNVSAGVGALIAVIVGVLIFSQKTTVIIVEKEETKQLSMLGSASFDFENGSTEVLPTLNHGNLVINNTNDSCIIKRSDYTDEISSDDEDLISILLLVKPQSVYVFHGKELDYLFIESPEYLETKRNTSSYALINMNYNI